MEHAVTGTDPAGTGHPNLLKRGVLIGFLAAGAMALLSAWASTKLPEGGRFPIHWNAAGQVDGYGSRFDTLWLLPLIALATGLLVGVLPRFEPRSAHMLRSSKPYTIIKVAVLAMLFVVHAAVVGTALGYAVDMNRAVGLASGVVFIVIGNYMGKMRSNFIAGMRTPWTLSSELSWNKTHRLGGKLLMASGLVALVVALVEPKFVMFVVTGLVPLTGILAIYSYMVWKSDPKRLSRNHEISNSGVNRT